MRWLKTWFARAQTAPSPAGVAAQAETAPVEVRERIEQFLGRGNAAAALEEAQTAADRYPSDAAINVLYGNASLAAGNAEAALDAFHLAAYYDPGNEDALGGRVAALARLDRGDEVAGAYQEFLSARPSHAGALHALAQIASDAGDFERARELMERLLERHADHVGALNDLGLLVAREFADFAKGEALLRCALERAPNSNHTRVNLGWVLCELRDYGEGFQLLDDAIARDPGDQEARLIRTLSRLKRGDYAAGWDEYDVRFASHVARRRPFAFPGWDGAPLAAERLLVYGEQGLGDQIMFASCLPDVLARVPHCTIECEPRLGALFARSFPAARVVTGSVREAVPDWLRDAGPFDRQIALGSLPRLFRRQAADFPSHRGYLRADPARVGAWRGRLAKLGSGPKIGISWRGGTRTSRRGLRSLDLVRLAPLLTIHPAHWISLQYGDCAEELATLHRDRGVAVHHWQEAIDDYDETAALVCGLDLVVSVCTAIIHLAGALGQPTLVMVPYASEWRYGADGTAMPWYPSVCLLRQRAPGDWDEVLDGLRRELLTRFPAGA